MKILLMLSLPPSLHVSQQEGGKARLQSIMIINHWSAHHVFNNTLKTTFHASQARFTINYKYSIPKLKLLTDRLSGAKKNLNL
jgi:hypothetical protein